MSDEKVHLCRIQSKHSYKKDSSLVVKCERVNEQRAAGPRRSGNDNIQIIASKPMPGSFRQSDGALRAK